MKDYSTYIFDLDGTLLDTLADLAASTNAALAAHSMPTHSINDVRRFVGNGIRKLIERAVPEGTDETEFEAVFKDFQQHYLQHSLDTTQPYPGIMDVLEELRRRGKRVAVVSNKFYLATEELCRHFFSPLVEVAIGEREGVVRRKPAPDAVNEALRRLGMGKEDAVYIGDSDVDLATARNSGLPCISVLWGFRDRDFLVDHGGTTFVSEPRELLA